MTQYKRSDHSQRDVLYSQKDVTIDPGFPGQFPFTRGVQPNMYRGRLWTMRQYAGFGSAEQTNQRFLDLLQAGQTGLSMAFDLPTQMGYDPDDPMSQGEVGRVGVSIANIDDMTTVLNNIPLDQVSSSMTINATAPILLCFYIAVAQNNGIDPKLLKGTVQNDILKEYIARGTYIFPPKASMRLCADLIEYCSNHVPLWNPISISGYHIREAGSDAVQEIAFTLSNAVAYAQTVVDRNIDFDHFAARLSFFFAAHNDLIEEVAKFRAARTLWALITKDVFKAKKTNSMLMRFHAQTGGSTLTAQQVDNNIVRTTVQALAAILGGCQSLHTNSKDEALALPSKESAMLALRTQQLLAYESGIAHTVDPLAGSFAIEHETELMIKKVQAEMEKIESMGGSQKAIENNYYQKAIAERAYQFQKDLDQGKQKIVGVNCYQSKEDPVSNLLKLDINLEKNLKQKMTQFKTTRDQNHCTEALTNLNAKAKTSENLLPYILKAVHAKATLGEITQSLKDVFGRHQAQ
ncbi:MAG TPA: methylmalonyl-CoA mutase family protein [Oligoflexia bacterium]|nr:methylmalonyl-CoA mutase family protein [Oligoflexia bacterium]HMR24370.1 methylmalonyl-CoA mutase family protein [Oligoflexia bacterium]